MNASLGRLVAASTVFLAVCALALGAPPAALSSSSPPAVVDRVFADPSEALAVKTGQLFLISLAANPSTGYHWKVSTPPDASVVTFKGSAYHAVKSGLMGAPGEELFVYQAHGAGDAVIALDYVAPGTNAVVAKTVRFRVVVAKP
jgi:inhibitor of cysteine peptidase